MQSTKRPYLVIDGDNELYRAFFKHSNMEYGGQKTGALFGMPRSVSSMIKKLKPKKVFIVWDGKKDPIRKELAQDYKLTKARLGVDKEDAFRQKNILMAMFTNLGIDQLHKHNIEGDDHTYMMVRELRKKGRPIVIVSTDKDFRQLISEKVSIWNDRKNEMTTKENCKSLHGYDADECVDTLCLMGDKSDNLAGYPGMGEKTTRKLLDEFGSIRNFLSDSSNEFSRLDHENLKRVYSVMREMVDLKYFYNKNLKGKKKLTLFEGDLNPKKHRELCEKYGLKTHQGAKFIKSFQV